MVTTPHETQVYIQTINLPDPKDRESEPPELPENDPNDPTPDTKEVNW